MSSCPDKVLRSPDGRVEVRVSLGEWCADGWRQPDTPLWELHYSGRRILRPSKMGFSLSGQPPFDGAFEIVRRSGRRKKSTWAPAFGDAAILTAEYCEQTLALRERAAPHRRLDLVFRCYNEGACVCARLPRQRGLWRVSPTGAGAVFRFPEGAQAWVSAFPGTAMPTAIDLLCEPIAWPVTLNFPHGKLACLLAADGSGLRMQPLQNGWALLAREATETLATPYEGPWLVWLLADRPCDLPANSGLLMHLARNAPLSSNGRTAKSDFRFSMRMTDRDATDDCRAPFLCYPLWHAAAGMKEPVEFLESGMAARGVTPAHRLALDLVCGKGSARWDETRFLRGEIGAYIVVARRNGTMWQVAAITGAESRVLTVRLADFLPGDSRQTFSLEILRDPLPDETAAADGLVKEVFEGLDACDRPRLELPPGGGFVLRLEPELGLF